MINAGIETDNNALRDNAMSEDNAMNAFSMNNKIGQCLHCHKEFEKNTTWQKYCTDNHRIAAYELRTGKRIRLKKVGVDSQ